MKSGWARSSPMRLRARTSCCSAGGLNHLEQADDPIVVEPLEDAHLLLHSFLERRGEKLAPIDSFHGSSLVGHRRGDERNGSKRALAERLFAPVKVARVRRRAAVWRERGAEAVDWPQAEG
eukprot:scaffold13154_cov27-Tisochrysis_lutea.AAC.3